MVDATSNVTNSAANQALNSANVQAKSDADEVSAAKDFSQSINTPPPRRFPSIPGGDFALPGGTPLTDSQRTDAIRSLSDIDRLSFLIEEALIAVFALSIIEREEERKQWVISANLALDEGKAVYSKLMEKANFERLSGILGGAMNIAAGVVSIAGGAAMAKGATGGDEEIPLPKLEDEPETGDGLEMQNLGGEEEEGPTGGIEEEESSFISETETSFNSSDDESTTTESSGRTKTSRSSSSDESETDEVEAESADSREARARRRRESRSSEEDTSVRELDEGLNLDESSSDEEFHENRTERTRSRRDFAERELDEMESGGSTGGSDDDESQSIGREAAKTRKAGAKTRGTERTQEEDPSSGRSRKSRFKNRKKSDKPEDKDDYETRFEKKMKQRERDMMKRQYRMQQKLFMTQGGSQLLQATGQVLASMMSAQATEKDAESKLDQAIETRIEATEQSQSKFEQEMKDNLSQVLQTLQRVEDARHQASNTVLEI